MSHSEAKVARRREVKLVVPRRHKGARLKRHNAARKALSPRRKQELLEATAFAQANFE